MGGATTPLLRRDRSGWSARRRGARVLPARQREEGDGADRWGRGVSVTAARAGLSEHDQREPLDRDRTVHNARAILNLVKRYAKAAVDAPSNGCM